MTPSGDRLLKEGAGWRLGWDPAASTYTGLVGGDHWAVELTADELADLRRLLPQLTNAIAAIAGELMPDESLDCEVESKHLWLGASGYPTAYELRLLLKGSRGFEGTWSSSAVPGLLGAIHTFGHI